MLNPPLLTKQKNKKTKTDRKGHKKTTISHKHCDRWLESINEYAKVLTGFHCVVNRA
jgi:hypothetical protein